MLWGDGKAVNGDRKTVMGDGKELKGKTEYLHKCVQPTLLIPDANLDMKLHCAKWVHILCTIPHRVMQQYEPHFSEFGYR